MCVAYLKVPLLQPYFLKINLKLIEQIIIIGIRFGPLTVSRVLWNLYTEKWCLQFGYTRLGVY